MNRMKIFRKGLEYALTSALALASVGCQTYQPEVERVFKIEPAPIRVNGESVKAVYSKDFEGWIYPVTSVIFPEDKELDIRDVSLNDPRVQKAMNWADENGLNVRLPNGRPAFELYKSNTLGNGVLAKIFVGTPAQIYVKENKFTPWVLAHELIHEHLYRETGKNDQDHQSPKWRILNDFNQNLERSFF